MKPLLSFPAALFLAIMGIFGLIFLAVLGLMNLFEIEEFVGNDTKAETSAAIRACFVSAAIYGVLGVLACSQVWLHRSGNRAASQEETDVAIELVTLDPNEDTNPKSSTPLTRPSSVSLKK